MGQKPIIYDIIVGVNPVVSKGVTGNHILGLMMAVEKKALYMISGHSMDFVSNSLRAILKMLHL